ncbi:pleiotropic drug resistance ABC transporter [Dentipellis sp. KUC8613]|nr:pleiotropic drug resistance ABC transporter [Dentipellis sp. KUC8613]
MADFYELDRIREDDAATISDVQQPATATQDDYLALWSNAVQVPSGTLSRTLSHSQSHTPHHRTLSRPPTNIPAQDQEDISESPRDDSTMSQNAPSSSHLQRIKSNSSAAPVPVEYFDPEGMHELRRQMTLQSQKSVHPNPSLRREASEQTLAGVYNLADATGGDEKPFDFEKTLRGIRGRADEQQIRTRELGVLFKDLKVTVAGSSAASAAYLTTFGSLFRPSVLAERFRAWRSGAERAILSGFEGVVRPGEMLLVLGSPGAGCSTLLKTLANQTGEYRSVQGDIHYDSFTPQEMAKHYRGDLIYCPEDDVHFPTLSVGDTLKFAAKMRAPQQRVNGVSRDEYVQHITEILSTIFGLRHVRNTPVGDASLRGVSGGEKKRVSIAEMLALRGQLGSWDNSTRGLDASTALEFVRALRIATDVACLSTIVSIYQAGEQLYEHFDKVCVIYEGRMAYFGPANRARQYFIDMGYQPPERQTTADFLVAVTDPNGRTARPGFEARVPRTAGEFAEYFLQSPDAAANRADMDDFAATAVGSPERAQAYKESAAAEHARTQPAHSAYTVSIFMQARGVMLRRVQILRGNLSREVVQLATFILQGIIVGTVFLKSADATSAYFSRGGVLFFALLFAALSAMAEIPALFAQRPIVIKHYKAAMYHPFIEAAALTLVDIPITFITTMIFGIIIYFLVGLQKSASQFFTFFVFIFTMAITMKAWFRAVAAAFGSPAPAQTIAGILLLGLVLYTGYTIPKASMIGALRWISYINPLRWGFEGIVANEFHTLNGTCSSLVPSGPGYENITLANQVCTTVGSQRGQATVDGNTFIQLSYGYSFSNVWRNFGFVVAFGILFVAGLLFFTEINTSVSTGTSAILFKRGAKAAALAKSTASADDEDPEKAPTRAPSTDGPDAKGKGSADGAQAMTDIFTWRHLQYDVPVGKGEKRRLLDDVSGYVAPGKLTALMGESGAGKTTLLNVLAQRQSTGVVTGERLVSGKPLPGDFQAQTGYCQQMDTHLPTQTVREALLFSAKLRQPPDVPDSEKEAYVDTVLHMCGLTEYADAIVGSLGVEHKKRTTIGVELAAKPKLLLFLDEPTSGLDSQSAWAIVTFLRDLADHGQAILCTIHQPSAELFQVFDRLLLLRKGGQMVYFGDIGENSRTMLEYFETHGGPTCPPNANPAEYILDTIGAGATAKSQTDWHEAWKHSDEATRLQTELEAIIEEGRSRPSTTAEHNHEFSTAWGYQLTQLLIRDFQKSWRDPTYLVAKFVLNIVSGIFIGFTFFRANDSIQGTQNKLFAIYMSTILAAPLSNQIQVPFIATRTIYEIRERPSRMYSWSALVTALILGEIPLNILGSTLYFLCWYWTVGLPSGRAPFTFMMFSTVFPLYYTTIAQAVAAMSPSPEIAAVLFSFLFSFVITFNGVLQPFRQLGWWQWMYRVSPFSYLIDALLGQIVGHSQINCAPQEVVPLTPPSGQTCIEYMGPFIERAGGYLVNNNATDTCGFCSARTTDQFLGSSFNIIYSHRWWNYGLIWAYILFNVFAIYAATYLFRVRRR